MMQWSSGDSLNSFNLNTKGALPAFNVLAFGALGDAATDDGTSIQSASLAARAAGGGVVYFPSVRSYYVCNSTLSFFPGVVYQGGMSGQSESFGPTQLRRTSGALPIWAIESASSSPSSYSKRVEVRDLQFHGSDLSGPLTDARYASLCRFERVMWTHVDGALLRLRAVQDCNFNDCEMEWGGSVAQGVGALSIDSDSNPQFNANELRFAGCRWETNTFAHVTAQGSSAAQVFNLHFHACKFESARTIRSAISCDNVTNLILDDAYLNVQGTPNSDISNLIQLTTCANPTLSNVQANATSSASVFNLINAGTGVRDLTLNRVFGAANIRGAIVNVGNTNPIWITGPVGMVGGSSSSPSIFSGSAQSQLRYTATGLAPLAAGSATAPSVFFLSEASLGLFRSGTSTVALSYGTMNLNGGRLVSNLTLASSGVTHSGSVAVSELWITVGASGFSLGIESGGSLYWINSTTSAT